MSQKRAVKLPRVSGGKGGKVGAREKRNIINKTDDVYLIEPLQRGAAVRAEK